MKRPTLTHGEFPPPEAPSSGASFDLYSQSLAALLTEPGEAAAHRVLRLLTLARGISDGDLTDIELLVSKKSQPPGDSPRPAALDQDDGGENCMKPEPCPCSKPCPRFLEIWQLATRQEPPRIDSE